MTKKMSQKTKQRVVEQLVLLANNAISPKEKIKQDLEKSIFPPKERFFRPLRYYTPTSVMVHEDIVFILSGEMLDIYEDLLRLLLNQEGWNEKFSEEYLGEKIKEILGTLLKTNRIQTAERYLDRLIGEYDAYFQKFAVFTPLTGFYMSPLEVYSGTNIPGEIHIGNIIIRHMAGTHFTQLIKDVELIVSQGQSTEKEAITRSAQSQLENLHDTVCSVFSITAEPIRAKERAEEETRRVLDLLQYAISVLYSNARFSLSGEVTCELRTTAALSVASQDYLLMDEAIGSASIELSPETLERLKPTGFFKAAEVLAKLEMQKSDLEKTLFRSIHWFATARREFEKANAFLNFMTCLETLLTPSGQGFIGPSLANQVSEGTACILEADINMRIKLKERVKKLYGVRSGITHGGEKVILSEDLRDLEDIARTLIVQVIELKDQFPTQKALLQWLDQRRLVG